MTLEEKIRRHISGEHHQSLKPALLGHVERVRKAAYKAAMEGKPPRRKPPRWHIRRV